MYVTKRLSQLLQSPETMAASPEGPNSGYLVIQDEESETYSCFGACKNRTLKELPFPQNKELTVRYRTGGEHSRTYRDPVFLIPVLNQPLSANRYYAVVPHRRQIGEAYACSREDDKVTCCIFSCISDAEPRPLDPRDVYQQIQIVPYEGLCLTGGSFTAASVAPDGFPPSFFRRKGWTIYTKSGDNCELSTAEGVDFKIRARLPDFNFSLPLVASDAVTVGKWYCPAMFVKEGTLTLREQVKRSMYYAITLEQRWEQIFACSRTDQNSRRVTIDASIDREEAFVGGMRAAWSEAEGWVWFRAVKAMGEEERSSVCLRAEVVQRMKWEEERFGSGSESESGFGYGHGWSGKQQQVKINRVEELEEWNEFGCYVLVERFCIRRLMDGSVVMTYDFKHIDKIKNKWH
ncbi:uncharacterized protein LOC127263682 [Andrographis paniculata]|uniref:uncharacterized protein LOC127263682 n=1 Tax=Andrographis paniculata TaxID=175694 RepID=UPI0021E76A93|nr:uncharacterized protein LOC127263682 [Andrographis paniculata]